MFRAARFSMLCWPSTDAKFVFVTHGQIDMIDQDGAAFG
jgi:hypothetical protein